MFGSCGNGECNIPSGHLWEKIEVGYADTCGLTTGGDLHCWGLNANALVLSAPSGTFTDLDLGYRHACVLDASNQLTCWGQDSFDQISDLPTGVFSSASVGVRHSLALTSSGSIVCAGDDTSTYGCSGIDHSGTYTEIISGFHHSYALDGNGNVTVFNNGQDPGTAVQTISAFGVNKDFVGVDTNGQLIHSLPVFELDN